MRISLLRTYIRNEEQRTGTSSEKRVLRGTLSTTEDLLNSYVIETSENRERMTSRPYLPPSREICTYVYTFLVDKQDVHIRMCT